MTILVFSLLIYITSSYGDQINSSSANFDSVQYSLDLTSLSYTFEDTKTNDKLELVPVNNVQAGFSVTKYGYSLGLSFEDPSQSEDTKTLGRSKAFDVQLSSTLKRHYIEIFYQRYQGLGIKIGSEKDPVDYNYKSLNYGVQGIYFINKQYDPYESLFHFNFQLKENSSWLLALEASQNKLSNINGILPSAYNSLYQEFIDVKNVEQSNFALMFGHTRLDKFFEHFHTQFLVAIGPNYANSKFQGGTLKDSSKTGSKVLIDFDIGYNYKKSVFGLSAKNSLTSLQGSSTNKLSHSRLKAQFYYHYFF